MVVEINHANIAAHDRTTAAEFFATVFGLADPTHWGPFATVLLGDGAHLHFAEPPGVSDIQMQHYAFRERVPFRRNLRPRAGDRPRTLG